LGDARVGEDLPYGGCGDLQAENEEFAVDAAEAQFGFSLAGQRTRIRIERMVRGCPGRFGRDTVTWRWRSRSRCKRRMVSGRTSRRSLCNF
jgi:hypothetical protein